MTQGLLRIYVEDKDGNVISFPLNEEQAVVKDWTRTAERMAGAPSVTGTVMHNLCLDNLWTKKEFVIIGGERYYVKQVPTSSKDTEDVRYKHDVTLVSERDILENIYFFDVVTKREDAQASDKPRSNTTDFSFTGDLKELVERLNDSLSYSKIYDAKGVNGFCIVIDDDVEIGEAQEVSITDAYFATAMQEIYNVFKVPYYWVGRICHVGYAQNEIEKPFEYGKDNGLLSVSKNNSEYRLINRITGMGSADNIPYYYPNTDPNGEPILIIKNMDRENIKSIQLTTINAKFGGSVGKTFCLGNIKEENATTELFNDDTTLNGIAKYAAPYIDEDEGGNYYSEDPVDYQEEQLPMILEFEFYAYVNDEIDASNLSINTNYKISSATTTIDFSKSSQPHWGQTCSPPIEGWDAEAKIIMPDGYEEIITANDTTYRCKLQGVHKLIINCTPQYKVSMHPASKPGALSWATIDWYCHINGSIKFKTFYGDVIYQNGRVFKIEESGISVIGDNLPKLDLVLQPSQDYGSFDAHIIGGSIATCAQFTITGIDFINPISKLMPYVYREQKGAERFYNALNDTYLKENGEYYSFNNPYLPNEPLEGKQDFEDIKPTINGITNAQGQLFGEVADIAFDETDSDDLAIKSGNDSSAELVHSYFYIKLHKFDGDCGFNLFKQGLSKGAMTLNFITGSCAGCAFEVGVSKPSQVDNHYEFENPIQVDELGNIVAGDYDDKVKEGNPIESQQDTTINEVWIALKKDQSTFGVVMPNATNNYRPKAGDKFVITNILLPQAYITAAEKRLEAALIKYMSENNDEKFTFSIKFSRIYLQKHIGDIVPYLNENAKINIRYNKTVYPLYVSSYTQKYDGNILDEISVELSEELTITQNKTKQQMDSILGNVNEQINSALKGNSGNQNQNNQFDSSSIQGLLSDKLSRKTDDTAAGLITFLKGLVADGIITAKQGVEFGEYMTGLVGRGGKIDALGHGELRSLTLHEWLEVPEIRFNRITVNIGLSIMSEGGGIIQEVVPDVYEDGTFAPMGSAWLKLEDGEYGAIALNDLNMGIWHDFGGGNATENADDKKGTITKRGFKTVYFRITDIPATDPDGKDNSDHHFFRYALRSVEDGGNNSHPCAQMHFAQRGNTDDTERQGLLLSTTKYDIRLAGVNSWYFQDNQIYKIEGDLRGFSMQQIGSDGNTYTKHFHGSGLVFGNAYMFGKMDEFERAGYRMEITRSGDGRITSASPENITIRIINAYGVNVTSRFTTFKLTRDSGDPEADAEWNKQHESVATEFTMSAAALGTMAYIQPILFTVTASAEGLQDVSASFTERYVSTEELHIEFQPIEGKSYTVLANNVDTTIEARLYFGQQDITDDVLLRSTSTMKWTRDSGIPEEDAAWKATTGETKNIIHIVDRINDRHDCGVYWLKKLKVLFTFTASVQFTAGGDTQSLEGTMQIGN